MKYLLIYHERLGDVIQVMAMGAHLVEQGHQVWIECEQQYHSIFKLNDDLMPVYPDQKRPQGFKFDRVLNLQIWPSRYQDFRKSKLKWWDYVTNIYPDLSGSIWQSPFKDDLIPKSDFTHPEDVVIIAPTGYSQVPPTPSQPVIDAAIAANTECNHIILKKNYRATDLCRLVAIIKEARDVWTINTSVTYIADAVRGSYHHIPVTGFGGQDDFYSDKQIRHNELS